MNLEATKDVNLIKRILKSDCVWGLISEPTINKEKFEPDMDNFVYVKVSDGDLVVGLYMLKSFNGYTIEVHPVILKKHRNRCADKSYRLLESILRGRNKVKSMICFVPEIYRNCVYFALKHGFKKSGTIPSSTVRNGKFVDQLIMSKVL